ncbi:MAG: hypothetical protein ABIV47_13145 [Roseiflexaceae bacterium]
MSRTGPQYAFSRSRLRELIAFYLLFATVAGLAFWLVHSYLDKRALQDLPDKKSGFTASESPEEFFPFFEQVDHDSLFIHGFVTG